MVVFVLAGVGLFRARPDADLGGPAPLFTLATLGSGDDLSLVSLRGRPVVLNFWASWCEPCRDEAPSFAEAASEHSDVTFLGVNILDGRSEALAYVDEFAIPYSSVRDTSGRLSRLYGVTGVPETFFIDASGEIVGRYIGAFDGRQLATLVSELAVLEPGQRLEISGRGQSRPVP